MRTCTELTETVDGPWVVLSNGVARDDFPRAVELACAGGASGALAGRAIWTPALEADDPRPILAGPCRQRLAEIAALVRLYGPSVDRGHSLILPEAWTRRWVPDARQRATPGGGRSGSHSSRSTSVTPASGEVGTSRVLISPGRKDAVTSRPRAMAARQLIV